MTNRVPSLAKRAMRRSDRTLKHAARMANPVVRATPDFLLIGTQRGGTTSLFDAITRCEGVLPPTRKEVHFFDRFWRLGRRWYLAHFPPDEADRRWLTGEATADYLFASDAPSRARSVAPSASILVVLRDPIERSYSAWKLMTRKGRESRDFAEAVEEELATRVLRPHGSVLSRMPFGYLARGLYAGQLENWLSEYQRQRIHVVIFEELFSGDQTGDEIVEFLGLRQPLELRHLYATRETSMDPGTRNLLQGYFLPHNLRLASLLGRDLPW